MVPQRVAFAGIITTHATAVPVQPIRPGRGAEAFKGERRIRPLTDVCMTFVMSRA
jgi:hypothetical protein